MVTSALGVALEIKATAQVSPAVTALVLPVALAYEVPIAAEVMARFRLLPVFDVQLALVV